MRSEMGRTKVPCRHCCELMDAQASVCPHCRHRTFAAELRRLGLKIVFLVVVVATTPLWLRVYAGLCGSVGKQVARGVIPAAPAHAPQKAMPAKVKPVKSPLARKAKGKKAH
jgi:hypothetical protein